MSMDKCFKTVALIPARGGSKSIKLKNITLINNRPLIYWALDAAVQCEDIERVFVSTDSKEIEKIVNEYKSDKVTVIDRSEVSSTDTASTEAVLLEFADKVCFNDIILIQATSPLIEAKYLEEGFKKYLEKNVDSVLSVVRQKRFIWIPEGDIVKPYNYNPNYRPRRQEFEGFLVENGAFYITSKDNLFESKCRISGNIATIEMPDETYFEIDEPSDWIIVEGLLKHRDSKLHESIEKKIKKIKCVFMDSDGVLTDGGMYYSENGDEMKKFNTKDGMGIELLKKKGIITGIITGEKSELVSRRGKKLKVDEIYLGIKNKLHVINILKEKYKVNYDEIAYIGDDINDIDVISKVGFGCCVADGMECAKKVASYVTLNNGGYGAVREIADLILSIQ